MKWMKVRATELLLAFSMEKKPMVFIKNNIILYFLHYTIPVGFFLIVKDNT